MNIRHTFVAKVQNILILREMSKKSKVPFFFHLHFFSIFWAVAAFSRNKTLFP